MSPATPSKTVDVRALKGTREVIAHKDGGLFPVLALTGNTVVAVLRGGAGHLGLDGRVEVIRSLDAGDTWTPPAVVADSERDDRNPAFGVTPDGILILSYHRQGNYDDQGNYIAWRRPANMERNVDIVVTRSHDAGLTWEQPFSLGVPEVASGSPYGKIVALGDGTLLMPVYGGAVESLVGNRMADVRENGDCSYLVRSSDAGQTWSDPSLIGVNMNETALAALPDGDVVAVMRGIAPEQALHVTRSSDGGRTWSDPVQLTGARQHPADLVSLNNGDLLLTYGNRMPPYRVEGRVSRDGGRTWLPVLLTFSGHLYGYNVTAERPTDLGYPSTVIPQASGAARGVTVYYYNPSVNKPWVRDDHTRETRYLARDYYAIAVTWDEQALIRAVDQAINAD